MSKVLILGQIVIERQYLVNKIAKTNQVSFVRKINSLASSKELNASRVIVSHNKVDYLSCVGMDSDGEMAINHLEKYGLNYDKVHSVKSLPTGQVVVMTDSSGSSAITVFVGANDEVKVDNIDVSDYDFIYTSTANPLNEVYKLIELSKKKNIPILVDFPNKQDEFDKDKLKNVNFVVPNRHEAGALLGEKIITVSDALRVASNIKKFTNGSVIITLDKDGCVAFEKSWTEPKHFPTRKVKTVDMTASGDIFRGVFTDQFLKTGDFVNSVQKSLFIATKSCTVEGVDNSKVFSRNLL